MLSLSLRYSFFPMTVNYLSWNCKSRILRNQLEFHIKISCLTSLKHYPNCHPPCFVPTNQEHIVTRATISPFANEDFQQYNSTEVMWWPFWIWPEGATYIMWLVLVLWENDGAQFLRNLSSTSQPSGKLAQHLHDSYKGISMMFPKNEKKHVSKKTRVAYGTPFPLLFFPWVFFSFRKKERVGGIHKILFTSFSFSL